MLATLFPMKNYIKRLIEWKNTHATVLRQEELILDLRKIDAAEGMDVAADIAAAELAVAKRKAYIANITLQISEAKMKLAA
jgi:hypothetical protein